MTINLQSKLCKIQSRVFQSSANSLVINTNNATKGKSDESSKIEQKGTNQTSNIEDEEIDNDNIPLNKLYKCCHTTITKYRRNKKAKTKKYFVIKFFITSHNKYQ